MNRNYEFLVEKEEIRARMLMQVLQDNNITYTAMPVYGVGLAIKMGRQEILKIFVPYENCIRHLNYCKSFFQER